jgi:uncharacterized repeat protein (TIGR03803 family)
MINRVYVMAFLLVLGLASLAQAQTFTTLYSFSGGSDGGQPYAGLIEDADGNLYGTTTEGGDLNCSADGCGVVYELNAAGTETVLHKFSGPASGGGDAARPYTPVIRDNAGNIYGTTNVGGYGGWGAVFKIDSAGNETLLYSFTGGSDGCFPLQGLVRDKAGNLYGTTSQCGAAFRGTIFKLDNASNLTLLHTFGGPDGTGPQYGRLLIDKSDNLYGVTLYGGVRCSAHNPDCGVLYEVSNKGVFTVLHKFGWHKNDGCYPVGSVVQDKAGNYYGTTTGCGSIGYGIVWKVSKDSNKETILHNFAGSPSDGCQPEAGVTLDSKGNLYGVTLECGANRYGALFELRAGGGLTLLHSFDNSDGANPYGEVMRTLKGTLFGTTPLGGIYGNGTVWSYVP